MTSAGVMASARLTASPAPRSAKITSPVSRTLFSTIASTRRWALLPSPYLCTSLDGSPCCLSSRTALRAESPVRLVTTTLLTSMAGAWSHMPMHGVLAKVIFPSGVVWPKSMPSSPVRASAICSLPAISSMTSSQSRMTTWPVGCSDRNE